MKLARIIFSTSILIISSCNKIDELTEIDNSNHHSNPIKSKQLFIETNINAGQKERDCIGFHLDFAQYTRQSTIWDHMFFVSVIDRKTLEPWKSQEKGDFGHLNIGNKYVPYWNNYNYYFRNNKIDGIKNLISFIEKVPEGNYVFFHSFRGNNISNWLNNKPISSEYKLMLENIGANVDSLENYPNKWPYIIFFEKGNINNVKESFYDHQPYGFINLETKVTN